MSKTIINIKSLIINMGAAAAAAPEFRVVSSGFVVPGVAESTGCAGGATDFLSALFGGLGKLQEAEAQAAGESVGAASTGFAAGGYAPSAADAAFAATAVPLTASDAAEVAAMLQAGEAPVAVSNYGHTPPPSIPRSKLIVDFLNSDSRYQFRTLNAIEKALAAQIPGDIEEALGDAIDEGKVSTVSRRSDGETLYKAVRQY